VRHLLSTGEVTDKGMFYNASDEICLFLGHVSLTAGGNSTLLELGRLGVNYSMSACDNTSTGNSKSVDCFPFKSVIACPSELKHLVQRFVYAK